MIIYSLKINLWYSIFTVSMMSYYWLQAARVNTMGLSDNPNKFILAFIFRDNHVGRGMVLLVTHENMRYQRTLAW